jgi:magnesium-transporting ATPase (P-type)
MLLLSWNSGPGDKLQTAIEIGFSCNLLKSDMELMILSADSVIETRAKIEAGLNKIASILGPPSLDPRKRGFMPGAPASFAIVIDGDTLTHALSEEVKPLFLTLGTQCETVVCCRVSPLQKALTVKLVSVTFFLKLPSADDASIVGCIVQMGNWLMLMLMLMPPCFICIFCR